MEKHNEFTYSYTTKPEPIDGMNAHRVSVGFAYGPPGCYWTMFEVALTPGELRRARSQIGGNSFLVPSVLAPFRREGSFSMLDEAESFVKDGAVAPLLRQYTAIATAARHRTDEFAALWCRAGEGGRATIFQRATKWNATLLAETMRRAEVKAKEIASNPKASDSDLQSLAAFRVAEAAMSPSRLTDDFADMGEMLEYMRSAANWVAEKADDEELGAIATILARQRMERIDRAVHRLFVEMGDPATALETRPFLLAVEKTRQWRPITRCASVERLAQDLTHGPYVGMPPSRHADDFENATALIEFMRDAGNGIHYSRYSTHAEETATNELAKKRVARIELGIDRTLMRGGLDAADESLLASALVATVSNQWSHPAQRCKKLAEIAGERTPAANGPGARR